MLKLPCLIERGESEKWYLLVIQGLFCFTYYRFFSQDVNVIGT